VVPTWNRVSYLAACLESLLVQDYPQERYEIIVVDDGSKDKTESVVRAMQQRVATHRLRYVRQEHQGLNAARNAGIASARGQLIGFIDDDEIAPASLLTRAARLLDGPWGPAAVGGWCRVRLEGTPPAFFCRGCRESYKAIAYLGGGEPVVEVADLPGGCLFVPRETFERYGRFLDELSGPGDDAEWCARVRWQGGRLLMGRDLWVWHRVLPGDLRLRGLWAKCVLSPAHYARARRAMDYNGRPADDVRQAIRFLAHGLRRGCRVGLAQAAGRLLLAWQWSKCKDNCWSQSSL
jgi:glycosyltransferase involved in cell wall biosynthesis